METLFKDMQYAMRTLSRSPGFVLSAILTLGLGIGATTMVFSLVNAVLLRPFPFAEPERLVDFTELDPDGRFSALSYPNYVDYRAINSLSGLAAYTDDNITVRSDNGPERLEGATVSHNLFDVLGVRPLIGRSFNAAEESTSGERVVVLSYGLFQRTFAGDRNVLGSAVTVQGEPHTIIGVMPPGFAFPERADVWVPLRLDATANRGSRFLQSVGRLQAGASIAAVKAEADAIAKRINEGRSNQLRQWTPQITELRETMVREVKPVVLIMLAAVGFVLLIACANVANLLLARAAAREKEIAIRTALGAGRIRLIRQLLTESALLGLGGGLLGVLLASWWIDLLLASIPVAMPYWMQIGIDRNVLLFTLFVAIGTALVFGLAPALQSVSGDVQVTLKEGRGTAGGLRKSRLRAVLVVAQLALAMILLVGGLLMVKSFLAMRRVDPGFRIDNVIAIDLDLPGTRYDDSNARGVFYNSLVERVRALPGIESASAISILPISGNSQTGNFSIDGQPNTREMDHAQGWKATPGYFETMGIPVVRGRAFTAQDGAPARVAIINQTMARKFFGNSDPVGQRIAWGAGNSIQWMTIVGVVADIRQTDVNQTTINPDLYTPMWQDPDRAMTLVVRSSATMDQLIPMIRREVQTLDANAPMFNVKSMGQVVAEAVWDSRLFGSLFGAFAAAALILAAVGLYGVIAYTISQRTQEIGLRVALGAGPANVVAMVLRQGIRLALVGTVLGLAGAFGMARAMSSLLYGVQSNDAFTFVFVPVLLVAVALLACYIPARRALRVDPMTALRLE